MTANGYGLCVRAGFGLQNCQPALRLNRIAEAAQSSKFAPPRRPGSPRLTQTRVGGSLLFCIGHSIEFELRFLQLLSKYY